jgi:hypothetical protein
MGQFPPPIDVRSGGSFLQVRTPPAPSKRVAWPPQAGLRAIPKTGPRAAYDTAVSLWPKASGEPMLRLHDRDLCERIRRSLEWKIAQPVAQRRSAS